MLIDNKPQCNSIRIHTFSLKKMHLKMSSVEWRPFCFGPSVLTHRGRVTHICVGKLTIIGSDNSLSLERRQVIIWTNAAILLIGPLGTNFSEIFIEIQTFSLKKIRLKMSPAKCCSFRLGLNVLKICNAIGSHRSMVNYNVIWHTIRHLRIRYI